MRDTFHLTFFPRILTPAIPICVLSLFRSVANLVASGCRASLQLVDHSRSLQDHAYYLCRHIIFSTMMYNDISQYSSSTVSMDRSFPASMLTQSSRSVVSMEILDQCREQCSRESDKALELLSNHFDQTSSATQLLRSIVHQIQKGLQTKTVI